MPVLKAQTVGSQGFDPDELFENWAQSRKLISQPSFQLSDLIKSVFKLRQSDSYEYHAVATVNLNQVQAAINAKGQNGLHDWYDGLEPPPVFDVNAYVDIFDPTRIMSRALTAFKANAKRGSIRESVAANLHAHNFVLEPFQQRASKVKSPTPNPYFDLWAWSCVDLEWAGPMTGDDKQLGNRAHHLLPVFYHHFGCIVPSHDALHTIANLSRSKTVLEIGCGGGYWAFMLRRHYGVTVVAIDNAASTFRTTWIGDIIVGDGGQYLKKATSTLAPTAQVLLLVYPQATGDFTASILQVFQGHTIIVAGSATANGFTGFPMGSTIHNWMAQNKSDFKRICQLPLPSFAGKDESLQVWIKEIKETKEIME